MPPSAIANVFTQPWASQIAPTQYGLGGNTGAKAVIQLPGRRTLKQGSYQLRLTDIDGRQWETAVMVE